MKAAAAANRKQETIATVGRVEGQVQPLEMPRYDPVNYILDKIDYEFYNAERAQERQLEAMRMRKRKLSARAMLKSQGVEFDTGDEISGGEMKQVLRDGYTHGMSLETGDGNDTGLGTGSTHDHSDLECGPTKHIVGKADFSEPEESGSQNYRDLDSDVAKQLDAQYKQILKKKSESSFRVKPKSSGTSTTLTQSFCKSKRQTPGLAMSDIDSIRTEDIEREFYKTMVHHPSTQTSGRSKKMKPFLYHYDPEISQASKLKSQKLKTKSKAARTGNSKLPKFTANPLRTKKTRRGTSMASDVESVRTEDFENQFHNIMVKQIGGVPITSFDQMIVDSDLDTVKSHIIREKLRAALGGGTEEDGESEEENYSSDDTEKFNTVIDTHKLHELLKHTSLNASTAGERQPSYESLEVLQHNSPRRDYGFSRDSTPSKFLTTPGRKSPYKFAQQNGVPEQLTDPHLDLQREEEEIERESARIRREIELERSCASPHAFKPTSVVTPSPGNAGMVMDGKSAIITSLNPVFQANPQHQQPIMSPRTSQPDQSHVLLDQNDQSQAFLQQQQSQALIQHHKERLTMQKEMKSLQQNLAKGRLEIKSLETQIKENRAKAEDARTEVMLAEFKRDSARKELEQVLQQVHQKRSQLRRIEEELEQEEDESEDDKVKVTQDQFTQLMGDREQLQERVRSLENQLKGLASKERQCEELERQLSSAKDALMTEQKKHREQLDSLKEDLNISESRLKEVHDQRASLYREVEAKDARLEEMTNERELLRKKHEKLEVRFKQMENDKNQLIKEKSQEYDEIKARMQEQLIQARANSSKETHELRVQLAEITEQLAGANSNTNRKEEDNLRIREQVLSLQQQLSEQTELCDVTKEEKQKVVNSLSQQKESALREQSDTLESNKREALVALQAELDSRHQCDIDKLHNKLSAEIRNVQTHLQDKEIEIQVLKDKVKQQETITRQVGEKIRTEAQDRFVKLMKDERSKWEKEKESEVTQLLTSMRDEMEKTSSRLREELTQERNANDRTVQQMATLRQELEEEKDQSRKMYREKLATLNHAKESVAFEKERELDIMKEKLEQETHKTIEKLRETVAKQEEEISSLKNEKIEIQTKEKQNVTHCEHVERTVLNEINEECRRVGNVLGKSVYNSYGWQVSPQGPYTRNQLQTSLANLRASNEELRKYVQELKYEVEAQKQSMSKTERERSEALEQQRRRMQHEKLQALESLKDRLIKEHLDEVDKLHRSLGRDKGVSKTLREKDKELRDIQYNMTIWKDQTTDKMAKKFQEELQREVEKRSKDMRKKQQDTDRDKISQQREIERLERELHRGTPVSFTSPAATNQMIQRLQNQVRQLQSENIQLRRAKFGGALSQSYTDLSNTSFTEMPTRDTNKRTDSQIQQVENRAKLAEDRAQRNETLLNQKMCELSKLQGTLTQQTKELMQLERAYSQLQHRSLRPTSSTRVSFAT